MKLSRRSGSIDVCILLLITNISLKMAGSLFYIQIICIIIIDQVEEVLKRNRVWSLWSRSLQFNNITYYLIVYRCLEIGTSIVTELQQHGTQSITITL